MLVINLMFGKVSGWEAAAKNRRVASGKLSGFRFQAKRPAAEMSIAVATAWKP